MATVMEDELNDKFRNETALVLFSGGQDSATCLAWSLARFARVETLGFRYGRIGEVLRWLIPRIAAMRHAVRQVAMAQE